MGPPLVVVVSVYDVDMRVQLLKSVEFCLKLLAVVFSKLVGKERLHMPLKLVLFNFYATESQGGRLNIYYYRKGWERLINKEISKTLEGYILVDNAEAENRRKMLGLSKFRILPKANGVRMVLDFSSSSRLQSLRDTHAVLKDIQIKEPDVLGSSVFDHDDFYRNLGPYLIHLRSQSGELPPLFFVVARMYSKHLIQSTWVNCFMSSKVS